MATINISISAMVVATRREIFHHVSTVVFPRFAFQFAGQFVGAENNSSFVSFVSSTPQAK